MSVLSCKFPAYFQNTFYLEQLWTAASVDSKQYPDSTRFKHFKENIHKIFRGCLLLPVWNSVVNMGEKMIALG